MSLCRVFAAALFLLGASTASAQDAAVERAIDEGLALRQQSRDAEALAVFERAYAQHREPCLLAQVGFAEQALGRWRLAEEHLREMQRAASDP